MLAALAVLAVHAYACQGLSSLLLPVIPLLACDTWMTHSWPSSLASRSVEVLLMRSGCDLLLCFLEPVVPDVQLVSMLVMSSGVKMPG